MERWKVVVLQNSCASAYFLTVDLFWHFPLRLQSRLLLITGFSSVRFLSQLGGAGAFMAKDGVVLV